MKQDTHPVARTPSRIPDEIDEHGRYRYPGEVEDAMPEGNWARWLATYLVETILRVVSASGRDSAYANLPIYYVKGDPGKHVSPDAFYLRDVPFDPHRISYRLWESGIPPRVAFEILSRGSEIKDRETNRRIYEQLGIAEYYWFDLVTHELQALELDLDGRYRERMPDEKGRYHSASLDLEVGVEGDAIALYRDGLLLPATDALLKQADRDRAEVERKRMDAERQFAIAERQRADAERALAAERELREAAEARIRELEERLRNVRGPE